MFQVGAETLRYYLIIFAGSAFLALVLGISSRTYLEATMRVLVLYLFALAALVFALGAPQEFVVQLYLPESFDRFLSLWVLAVVPLTIKRLWAVWWYGRDSLSMARPTAAGIAVTEKQR